MVDKADDPVDFNGRLLRQTDGQVDCSQYKIENKGMFKTKVSCPELPQFRLDDPEKVQTRKVKVGILCHFYLRSQHRETDYWANNFFFSGRLIARW